MTTEKYCELCPLHPPGEEVGEFKEFYENWPCPLLGGKNICTTDCYYDLAGGMGSADTLREVMKRSGKTAIEVHRTCVACPHGGPGLDKAPGLAVRIENGKMMTSGPEFEEAKKRGEAEWKARLKRLEDPEFPGSPTDG